jgi:cytidine deaminase
VEARTNAYAAYSRFAVGAALEAESGCVYLGCNVENASYGLTQCAERVALGCAVTAGERSFKVMAVVSENMVSPCGACRQALAEFSPEMDIVVADPSGEYRVFKLADLLPNRFQGGDLPSTCV